MSKKKPYHKKTILQVIPTLNSGGVERGTVEIAQHIIASGDISIVVSAGGLLVEQLTHDGSIHINLNVASKNPFTIWRNATKIARIIRDYNVDIVHARSRAPAWSCYLAARTTGIKLITTFHGVYNFKTKLKKYYNSVMAEGTVVIAVSHFIRNHIITNYKVNPDQIEVIYRGVNYQKFDQNLLSDTSLDKFRNKYNVPTNVPVILLPSRMTRWKGHLVLIDAIAQIKHLNFYCILAGDLARHPNFIRDIQNKIQKYKIQNRVQLFGNESKMIGLYGIADIVLSTSIEPEAFGRTIIEAQSMEKLVIATKIGGACETIQDNITGLHAQPNDSKELASKIEYALSILGTETAKNITHAARQDVINKFAQKLMLEKTIEIYKKN